MGTFCSAVDEEALTAPPHEDADQTYDRLRQVCDASLTDAQRDAIRATLAGPLARHARAVYIALEALDGPDPEMALTYLLDSIPSCRVALSLLDARLTAGE